MYRSNIIMGKIGGVTGMQRFLVSQINYVTELSLVVVLLVDFQWNILLSKV